MVCQFWGFFFCFLFVCLFACLFSGPPADLSSSVQPCCYDGCSVCFTVLPKCCPKTWMYLSALMVPFSRRGLPTPQALCNPRTRRDEGFGTWFPKRISSFDQCDDSKKKRFIFRNMYVPSIYLSEI